MKKINKAFRLLFTTIIAGTLFSCNVDDREPPKEEAAQPTDTATSMKAAPEPEFTPFDIIEIRHSVKDYGKWRPMFDTDSTERKAAGMENIVVAKNMDNPNKIYIALKASDLQKAKDFAAAPRLKDVMDKAGVNSKPGIQFFHVTRFNPNAKERTWVVVTHKVKDFDAWVKVFDNEGTAARADQGLYDALIGRSVNDPNMVMLVFDVKDVEKAKKSIMSEEKKKLMTGAGVEGIPVIEFYHDAD